MVARSGEQPVGRALLGLASSTPGLRRIRRPAAEGSPDFDLAYVRSGPRGLPPAVVIPGGPGLGSVLPYRGLRRLAASGGLDLVMVEHRGVGLSRRDTGGHDLPHSAMRVTDVVDDIAAVLDREGIDSAFIVGSSYGSYLASSFGARHPDRVSGMLLDSALQSTGDLEVERRVIRRLFWEEDSPIATEVRRLAETDIDQRALLDVTRAAYEFGGADLALPLLRQRLRRRDPVWRALESYATRDASITRMPAIYEFDLVGTIGFRELRYGPLPDGLPLDPALTYAPIADRFPGFAGEPFDLPALTPEFSWPMVLLSGDRDLRTPPAIAARVARTAREGVLVPIENGHSALDTHPVALLNALRWLILGRQHQLPSTAERLSNLPRRGTADLFARLLAAGLRLETTLLR